MIKNGTILLLLFGMLATACTSYEEPESGLDCSRQFINATYQGNFKRAKQLLINSDENISLLKTRVEADFRSRNSLQKESLSTASIVILNIEQQGDSVVIVRYQNAYNNQPGRLKCKKIAGTWKTDLSFSYNQ